MKVLDSTFVFCEGDHDVAYIHLILKHILHAKVENRPDVQAPSPLGDIVRRALEKELNGEENGILRYARQYRMDNHVLFVYKSVGKGQVGRVKELLSRLLRKVNGDIRHLGINGSANPTESLAVVKCLFVYDRDENTFPELLKWWRESYCDIPNYPQWRIDRALERSEGNWAAYGDKALYAWSVGNDSSTLEDILIGIVRDCAGYPVDESIGFTAKQETGWDWAPKTNAPAARSAAKACREKAAITISGQNHRPGRPLTAIIQDCLKKTEKDKDDASKVAKFVEEPHAKEFAAFLAEFVGVGDRSSNPQ